MVVQEPQQALAASCWLQSQGLPQLGRHQLGAQQLQFRPPEVGARRQGCRKHMPGL